MSVGILTALGCGQPTAAPSGAVTAGLPTSSIATGPLPPSHQACTRVIEAAPPASNGPLIAGASWLDAATLAVFVGGEDHGLLLHDIESGKRTRAFRPLEAEVGALRPGSTTRMLLAGHQLGVATLDLESRCLRVAEGLSIAAWALDPVHDRFFVAGGGKLARVDAETLRPTREVALPPSEGRFAMAYDASSDIVVLREGVHVSLRDAGTLEERGTLTLPHVWGGPWARPGRSEAAFVYKTPCTKRPPSPKEMRCLVGDERGLVLVDLGRRAEIARIPVQGAHGPDWLGNGGWSADGSTFWLTPYSSAIVAWSVDAKRATVSQVPDQLGPIAWIAPRGGVMLIQRDGRSFELRSREQGAVLWRAPLPAPGDAP